MMANTLGEILRNIYLAEDKMKKAWSAFDKAVMDGTPEIAKELENMMMEIGVLFIDASLEARKFGYECNDGR